MASKGRGVAAPSAPKQGLKSPPVTASAFSGPEVRAPKATGSQVHPVGAPVAAKPASPRAASGTASSGKAEISLTMREKVALRRGSTRDVVALEQVEGKNLSVREKLALRRGSTRDLEVVGESSELLGPTKASGSPRAKPGAPSLAQRKGAAQSAGPSLRPTPLVAAPPLAPTSPNGSLPRASPSRAQGPTGRAKSPGFVRPKLLPRQYKKAPELADFCPVGTTLLEAVQRLDPKCSGGTPAIFRLFAKDKGKVTELCWTFVCARRILLLLFASLIALSLLLTPAYLTE